MTIQVFSPVGDGQDVYCMEVTLLPGEVLADAFRRQFFENYGWVPVFRDPDNSEGDD